MNRYLLKGTGVGALGGLLFGFDTAVIAGATHQLTQVYSLTARTAGYNRSNRAGRHRHRSHVGRSHRAEVRRPRHAPRHGRALCHLRPGFRSCVELVCAAGRPLHRRPGHRRILGAWPGLHRRTRSRPMARTAGRHVPGEHRRWHPARLLLQLRHRGVAARRNAMALAAWNRRGPRQFCS